MSENITFPTNVTEWTNRNEGASKLSIDFIPSSDTLEYLDFMQQVIEFDWYVYDVGLDSVFIDNDDSN